ncbi:hypothetical protein CHU98_g9441, partial [Xylaria longipes]
VDGRVGVHEPVGRGAPLAESGAALEPEPGVIDDNDDVPAPRAPSQHEQVLERDSAQPVLGRVPSAAAVVVVRGALYLPSATQQQQYYEEQQRQQQQQQQQPTSGGGLALPLLKREPSPPWTPDLASVSDDASPR